jgi:transketolase
VTWTDEDRDVVRYARALAMDAVESAGNGHPGTAMSLAPAATLIFGSFLRHDPADPQWLGRDRFILSAGHSSLTLYTQLFLSGYGLELDDLRAFRHWDSSTPGHPEFGHTPGVELTTGPLGQGVATAVGMAMAARYEQGLLQASGPDSPFDPMMWVIASDGDLQEGVSAEAASLAGTQALSNLCVIWDDNRISIEGDTALAFTEDVVARFAAYGWRTHTVGLAEGGDVDVAGLALALESARSETSAPTFIRLQTVIAWPAPNAQNTAKAHGSALGQAEVSATKTILGLDPNEAFAFPAELLESVRHKRAARARADRAEWQVRFDRWKNARPEAARLLTRLLAHELPAGLDDALPQWPLDTQVSTRKASGTILSQIGAVMPELWGGSADLAESNNTTIAGATSFLPSTSDISDADPAGRVIHFGIREHAMGSILNGIALDGLTRPFGGTFLVFSDYMRGAVRLSAIMGTAVTYVWTHDSIGLGEDGPTHQPVEHLWALRGIPDFAVIRPADANETAAAWRAILHQRGPVGLVLTRQDVPTIVPWDFAQVGVARGGYVLRDAADPVAIFIATGSEVSLAVQAHEELAAQGVPTKVVSMPCTSWFDAQPVEYRNAVLPPECEQRIAIEAGATFGWWKYVGTRGTVIGLDHFGASAPGAKLFTEFGITVDALVAAVNAER